MEAKCSLTCQTASRPGWVWPRTGAGWASSSSRPALWPHMTVAGNVSFGLKSLAAPEARARLAQIIEDTGLGRARATLPAQLSAVRRAEWHSPEHWLRDPTGC